MKSKLILGAALLSFFNVSAMNQENQNDINQPLLDNLQVKNEENNNPQPLARIGEEDTSLNVFLNRLERGYRRIRNGHPVSEVLSLYPEEAQELLERIFRDFQNEQRLSTRLLRILGLILDEAPMMWLLVSIPNSELPPETSINAMVAMFTGIGGFAAATALDATSECYPALRTPARFLVRVQNVLGDLFVGLAPWVILCAGGYGLYNALRPSDSVSSYIADYCIGQSNLSEEVPINNWQNQSTLFDQCFNNSLADYGVTTFLTTLFTLLGLFISLCW